MSDRDRLVTSAGRTEVERVRYKEVKVEEVKSNSVTLRDEMHARANHYIKESRPYFPNEKLRTYIDCPYFLRLARILFCASFFGALVASGGSKIIPVFFLVACLLFFFIYCQHERVNQKSLPVVYKQPVLTSQRSLNAFYEVTVTELDGVALQNYQAGVGFVQLSHGKIEFQAFNRDAMKSMSDSKCHSRLMLVLFVMASAYNCYFIATY
ncbi:hypothetical protein OS493_013692 [Desmophyllum pertusum]|uniref:Uncharacterized protein n=1 Tax=Desmophyllum pertusum TaxID=174260 RepID=A0A9W9ZPQ4_9CNID|nr:hypothetical protein OS493_013692 [Desmophyllum pertusum]